MAPILTSILIMLLLLLFVMGWLVKYSNATKVKDWLEYNFLIFIPNYAKYRAKMMKKLQPGEVWVVDSQKVSNLNMSPKELKNAILMSGKGLTLP